MLQNSAVFVQRTKDIVSAIILSHLQMTRHCLGPFYRQQLTNPNSKNKTTENTACIIKFPANLVNKFSKHRQLWKAGRRWPFSILRNRLFFTSHNSCLFINKQNNQANFGSRVCLMTLFRFHSATVIQQQCSRSNLKSKMTKANQCTRKVGSSSLMRKS